ncbi:MAG: hypothetical protein GY842_22260 [bacterium]|nr:hypothetical protein [bacterium]
MIDERYTIVREDRFIEATRDSGYKSTASAVAELADNAFQAGANNFVVHFDSEVEPTVGRGRPKSPVVREVVCVDDGSGMTPEVLRNALRFGGTTRFNDRDGLGRYGMGLPNSSASQCRRVEVYTWQKGGEANFSFLDIDEIAAGRMLVVPEAEVVEIPERHRHLASSDSGTLIIWTKCDRLDFNGREDTLTRELPWSLGQTYRYYLARGRTIRVNGREVKPFDPLFLMPEAEYHGATPHGAPLEYELSVPGKVGATSKVTVRFSLLPEEWLTETKKKRKERLTRGIDRVKGFSIVRAGREIDTGYFYLRRPHHRDAWWSCEISFEPELDELFGVTHTKQTINLSERIKTTIQKDLSANIGTLTEMVETCIKKRHAVSTEEAETIAKERDRFLRTAPEIRDKDEETVERELREYGEEKATDERPAEKVVEDIKDLPFVIDFESLPGAPFYRVRTFGKTVVVSINREHAFYGKLYHPLAEIHPTAKTAIELLIFGLGKAETLAADEGKDWYDSQRAEWSRILGVYLDAIPSLKGVA